MAYRPRAQRRGAGVRCSGLDTQSSLRSVVRPKSRPGLRAPIRVGAERRKASAPVGDGAYVAPLTIRQAGLVCLASGLAQSPGSEGSAAHAGLVTLNRHRDPVGTSTTDQSPRRAVRLPPAGARQPERHLGRVRPRVRPTGAWPAGTGGARGRAREDGRGGTGVGLAPDPPFLQMQAGAAGRVQQNGRCGLYLTVKGRLIVSPVGA